MLIITLLVALSMIGSQSSVYAQQQVTVTTIELAPFIKYDAGSRKFSGFLVDLMDKIQAETGNQYKFNFRLVRDGLYGRQTENGDWNGMIGEVKSGSAQIAVAPLTLSDKRKRAVDFSEPFISADLVLLVKVERNALSRATDILATLDAGAWLLVLVGFATTIVVLTVIFKVNPYEGMTGENVALTTMAGRAAWLCVTTMTFQGLYVTTPAGANRPAGARRVVPVSLGGRVALAGWLFFAVVTLIAFGAGFGVRVSQPAVGKVPVSNRRDLAFSRSDMKVGCIKGGSTMQFLATSQDPVMKELYRRVMADDNAQFENFTAGFKYIQNGGAILMEKPFAEYSESQNCEVRVVGTSLLNRNMAMAFGKNRDTTLRNVVDESLRKLLANGYISNLWDGYVNNKACPMVLVGADTSATPPGGTVQCTSFTVAPIVLAIFLAIGVGLSFMEKSRFTERSTAGNGPESGAGEMRQLNVSPPAETAQEDK